ncbi:hypothetical protein MUK42_22647 [Musa troglodytarum]|uniref:Uncharacterized protein n=1 Tax=Musa troglodytarum TaxID=320322 RepID=A0A9E7K666_9LILI|nr:hypothetical protein MUK42_22647 [Musa troglodytarum]
MVEHLGYEHLDAALQEQLPTADSVDRGDGDEGGEHVDEAADDGGHEGGVVAEPDGLEEHGGVEHDDVDAGDLLEEGDEDSHGELRPVPPPQDGRPRVLDGPGLLARRHDVLVLVVDVRGAADPPEHEAGPLAMAALDEGVGSVREQERAEGDDGRRDSGERQADATPPATLNLGGGVVDEIGCENADGDHELEADVEHAAKVCRRHFREIERHRLRVRSRRKISSDHSLCSESSHVLTWLANPTPRRMRPRRSSSTLSAAPLMAAPTRKVMPPPNMDHFLPNALVTVDAKKEAIRAAK